MRDVSVCGVRMTGVGIAARLTAFVVLGSVLAFPIRSASRRISFSASDPDQPRDRAVHAPGERGSEQRPHRAER